MDNLELYYSIIEQLAPDISILINLCSKLAQLQQQTCIKLVNRVSAFAIASSLGAKGQCIGWVMFGVSF
jgi:hypothetical protein